MNSRIACLLLALAASNPALAFRDDAFQPDAAPDAPSSVREGEAWKEGAVILPPWPKDADLLEFEPDMPERPFRFYIDRGSLDIDPAGQVVRYTLVAESRSGVRNLSYEAIRCTIRGAYKVYAYGANGSFQQAPASDWLPLTRDSSEGYREDLWRNRFCVSREARVKPEREIVRSLKGRGSNREHTGFQAD